jgi:uncharacterized protein (DUF2236 family)
MADSIADMTGEGYFPRGRSVLRQVHEERVVGLLYGQRALLLQAMEPVAFAGLLGETTGLDAPFRRLVRTATTMETVYFGTRAEADAATAGVRALHARVPAARIDAHLLWILACLADSGLKLHERFVGRLDRDERARFWADYVTLGELFGLARSSAPATYADFRDYWRGELASDRLAVSDQARELATTVAFRLPLPARRQPVLRLVINPAITGSLPTRARELYGLPWGPLDEARLTALTAGLRAAAAALPRALWTGSCHREYASVARGEERRLAVRAAA